MTLPLITLLFALIGCLSPIVRASDQTTQSRAIGNDVVTACVRRIQNTCIFPNDYQFMRRVAYVESKFGRDLTTQWTSFQGYGGIWQMDQIALDYTQQYLSSADKSDVATQLNVNINALNRSAGDLQVPIRAAVAARAYVYRRVSSPIPIGVVAQAAYWKQWYNTVNGSGTAQKFIDDIAEMDRTYRCEFPGADLLFILDSSGSIGYDTFEKVREFVGNVVNQLKNIGVNNYRIAIENFSSQVTIVLPFTSDRATVSAAIASINYDDGATYMGEALDAAIGMFVGNSSSARPTSAGFPKIAVLVTDGEPNGLVDTVAAAASLRAAGVTLYAVGVGDGINFNLLNTIASTPSCLYVYTLSNYTALATDFPNELTLRNCETSANAPTDTNNISSVIDQNATAYYNFVANISTGITLRMSMASGATVMYASISAQQPSSADYDFMAQSTVGHIGQIFVSPGDFAKALGGNLLPNDTAPLYASITGIAADTTNNFTLQFDDGDQRINNKNSATHRYLSGAAYVVVVVSICIVSIIF